MGLVAVKPIEFSIKTETPYVNLGVPKNYTLNNYKHIADSQYVPKFENRISKLRKGAEDELIQVDIKTSNKPTTVTESRKESAVESDNTVTTSSPMIIDLEAPSYLTQPIEYPKLHIFVRLNNKILNFEKLNLL